MNGIADTSRIFVAKKQGFRLVRHENPRDDRQAIWELVAPDQKELRYAGISAMANETENDMWEHLFKHYSWLGKHTAPPTTDNESESAE